MAQKKKIDLNDLVNKIEELTKSRVAGGEVVSLDDYRQLVQKKNTKTLLVIDDDETMRNALKRAFEADGMKVLAAADGTQLSDVVDDTAVDLIILDIGLPWINGYELAKLMKEHDDLKSIPLVFISGKTGELDVRRGFEVGADDYIKKPFDIEKIRKTVRTLLHLTA